MPSLVVGPDKPRWDLLPKFSLYAFYRMKNKMVYIPLLDRRRKYKDKKGKRKREQKSKQKNGWRENEGGQGKKGGRDGGRRSACEALCLRAPLQIPPIPLLPPPPFQELSSCPLVELTRRTGCTMPAGQCNRLGPCPKIESKLNAKLRFPMGW